MVKYSRQSHQDHQLEINQLHHQNQLLLQLKIQPIQRMQQMQQTQQLEIVIGTKKENKFAKDHQLMEQKIGTSATMINANVKQVNPNESSGLIATNLTKLSTIRLD